MKKRDVFKSFAKMASRENAFLNEKYFVSNKDSRQIVNNSEEYSNDELDNKNEDIFYQSEFQRNEIFYYLRKWFYPKNCFSVFLIIVFIVILFSNLDYTEAHGIGILKGLSFFLFFKLLF